MLYAFKAMKRKLLLLLIVAVVAFAGGITVGSRIYANRGITSPTQQVGNASIMLDYGDGNVATYDNLRLSTNENLMQLMQQTAEDNNIVFDYKNYSGLGALITKIGGKTNGTENRYWQYWVNNKLSAVGASSYVVQPGDVIEWKFISSKQ